MNAKRKPPADRERKQAAKNNISSTTYSPQDNNSRQNCKVLYSSDRGSFRVTTYLLRQRGES